MAKVKQQSVIADFIAAAVAPGLVMGMIFCLISFLILVFYRDGYQIRVNYLFALYIFASVLIARIAIESGRAYAMVYTLALGLAMMVVINRFAVFQGPLASLSPLINLGLLGLVGYLADRIVFDCTLVEADRDTSGEGLLQSLGLVKSDLSKDKSTDDKQPRKRKRKHNPGVTILYFALLAIPLYGIGQLFLPSGNDAIRRSALYLLFGYFFCSFALLVTTSFLGLRRYLNDRGVEVPVQFSATWLSLGLIGTLIFLGICLFLPLPGRQFGLFDLPFDVRAMDGLTASRWGWGNEGAENSNPSDPQSTQTSPQSNSSNSQDSQAGNPGGNTGENANSGSSSGQSSNGGQAGTSSPQSSGSQSSGSQSSGSQSSGSQSSGSQSSGSQSSGSQSSGSQSSGSQSSGSQSSGSQSSGSQSSGSQSSGSQSSQSNGSERNQGSNSQGSNSSAQQSGSNGDSNKNFSSSENSVSGSQSADKSQVSPAKQGESSGAQSSDSSRTNSPRSGEQNQSGAGSNSDQSKAENNDPENDRSDTKDSVRGQQPNSSRGANTNSAETKAEEPPKNETETQQQSQSTPSSSSSWFNFDLGSWLGFLLKWITIAVLIGVVIYYVLHHRDELLQLWRDFMKWWNGLWGLPDDDTLPAVDPKTPNRPARRPFAAFSNPFRRGSKMELAEMIRYTFDAMEAWGAERGVERKGDATAEEYVKAISGLLPKSREDLAGFSNAYMRLAYAGNRPVSLDPAVIQRIWQSMEQQAAAPSTIQTA